MDSQSLFNMIPARPILIGLMSVQSWCELQMLLAACVIGLAFAQKSVDSSYHAGQAVSFISYVSLVLQAGFAFYIFWDGTWAWAHHATEYPRPLLTMAMGVIIIQQARHLLFDFAMNLKEKHNDIAQALFHSPEWVRQHFWH